MLLPLLQRKLLPHRPKKYRLLTKHRLLMKLRLPAPPTRRLPEPQGRPDHGAGTGRCHGLAGL